MRTALGSDVGRKGKRRKGWSSANRAQKDQLLAQYNGDLLHGLLVSCAEDYAQYGGFIPLAFNSPVQRLTNSETSSGSTVVLVYASSQCGFVGIVDRSAKFAFFLDLDFPWPSLPLIREKMLGIVKGKGSLPKYCVGECPTDRAVRLKDQRRIGSQTRGRR